MMGDDISAVDNKFKVFGGNFSGLLSFTDSSPRIGFHKLRPNLFKLHDPEPREKVLLSV